MIAPSARVAFLGDSISDPTVTMGQWCDMVAAFGAWTRINATGTNRAAVSGCRIGDVLANFDARTAGADAAVVCIGMNDLPAPDTTADKWVGQVQHLLGLLSARHLPAVWVGVPRRNLTDMVIDPLAMDGLTHRACHAAGVLFVPLMPQMTVAMVSPDNVHPTFDGQQYMAGRTIAALGAA